MKLDIRQFYGEAPSVPPRKLGDGVAAHAQNTRYDKHRLEAWHTITDLQQVTNGTNSIYKYQGSFIISNKRRSYVKDIIPNDAYERIVYTEEGTYPQIRSGQAFYRLGIPVPTGFSASVNTEGDKTDALNVETWYYVCTFVTAWGEEGPPSVPTQAVEVGAGGVANLNLPTFPNGQYNFVGGKIRVYRSNNGTNESYFQYLNEYVTGGVSVQDSALSSTLQEVLPSTNWVGPPDDNSVNFPDGPLRGLTALPNGILMGYTGNSVYLSEPYLPHAWPYKKSTSSQIIGISSIAGGGVVLTDQGPYMLIGTQPASMVLKRIDSDKACVSEDSIVDMGDYTIYSAQDGLIGIDANGVNVLSKDYFTKEDWMTLQPETITGMRYEDKYIFFYGDPTDATGYMFDPLGGTRAFTKLTDIRGIRGYNDPDDDKTYILYRGADFTWRICEFATGNLFLPVQWHSKIYELPKQVSFRAASLTATTYPASVDVWADGVYRYTIQFTNNKPRLLPGGFRASEWQFRFFQFTDVESLVVAESMMEVT